jgi:hypothetical protein
VESNPRVLSVKGGKLESVTHCCCFGHAVVKFVIVISIGCKAYTQGAHSLSDFDPCNEVGCLEICARGGELYVGVIILYLKHAWHASIGETPLDSIPEAFQEVESTIGA